ncbi:probable RNA-binding protein CG14230 [Amyelois transitella]|uniref:probable RNA-binding protein CG14230 n=1 Tax=Amyelois transitella TaxID=680683 RepID=UPI00299020B6|nr:probable RNA-binding protein CG14230 [Amyelois transitella]
MSHTRLFVGNLPDKTSNEVLREAFSVYGDVTNLEIKSKSGSSDEKKFAFVTLSGSNYDIESCIKHFTNENFNGNKLYVTRARESFLERLQRERNEAQQKETTKKDNHEFLPEKTPILKLSNKLNPRKRVNDDKAIIDTNQLPLKKPFVFEKSQYSELPAVSAGDPVDQEKDKKKQDSDKKRMESMKKKRQEFKQKQMIIKTGLIGIDKVQNKKIVFSDAEDDDVEQNITTDVNIYNKKSTLFDDDDDGDGELNFEIKKQYEGKQGQKVLDLQSRYKSDKRFILDERFVDEDKSEEGSYQPKPQCTEEEVEEVVLSQTDEKIKQLNILQDVLGVAIKSHITQPIEAKDKKKAKLGMLRFDPSQPDHAKFLAPKEETNQETLRKVKKKKLKESLEEKPAQQEQETNKVEVSKEQFYKVSDSLKEAIAQPTTFSLRSLFGTSQPDEKDNPEQDSSFITLESKKEKKVKNPLDPGERNPFVYDSSESDDEAESKETKPQATVPTTEPKSVWKENLFFSDIDNRLKEGLDFFSRPLESQVTKERRELKSVMKKRLYNKERKNQMFQKKIGGRKKTMKKTYRKKS